jgi:FkbM family methyltransferase
MQAGLKSLAAKSGRIQTYAVLLGSTEVESVALHCAETASSVLREHHQQHPSIMCRQTTLDAVTTGCGQDLSPALLKIDVQGYELEVRKGAEKSLDITGAILAEVDLLDLHAGVSLIAEVVAWLNERDFVAFDVCDFVRRPLDQALWQMDVIFVPRDGPLRADKRWNS